MQNERSVINDVAYLAMQNEAEHRAMVALRLRRAKMVFDSKGLKKHWNLPLELSGRSVAEVFQDVDSVLARCVNEFYLSFAEECAGLSDRDRLFLACCLAYEGMREHDLRNPYLHCIARQSILNPDGSLRDVRESSVVFAMEVTGQAMLPMPEFQIVWEKLMAMVCIGEAHYYNWGTSPECWGKYEKILDEDHMIQEDLLNALHCRDRFDL